MKKPFTQFIQWFVFSGFIFTVIFSLYLGADFYQSMNTESNLALNQRTILLYFNHRFNQADSSYDLNVVDDRIVIKHDGYFTLIYEENGKLVEQVSEVDTVLESSGQVIAEILDLQISEKGNQIEIDYVDTAGLHHKLKFSLKSQRGVQ